MKKPILMIFVMVAVMGAISITGCTRDIAGDNSTQMANPASKFCIDNGGTIDIVDTETGQVGYCTISGVRCEEWALFRGECSKMHICTAKEKAAEICTMEYNPVCGSDAKTYGNRCTACSADIDHYVPGPCDAKFDVAEVLNGTCTQDNDCTTPESYLLRSSCPFTSKCIDGQCAVVCPRFDGKEYPQVRECADCPSYASPGPDFCRNGTIAPGATDECGCQSAPTCIPTR